MEDVKEFKRALRKEKIAAREGLTEEERVEWSKTICERVLRTEEYKKANVIFAYKWYKGEVEKMDLDVLARICYVLDCSPSDIISYEERK